MLQCFLAGIHIQQFLRQKEEGVCYSLLQLCLRVTLLEWLEMGD
jgi:hypothetical protein